MMFFCGRTSIFRIVDYCNTFLIWWSIGNNIVSTFSASVAVVIPSYCQVAKLDNMLRWKSPSIFKWIYWTKTRYDRNRRCSPAHHVPTGRRGSSPAANLPVAEAEEWGMMTDNVVQSLKRDVWSGLHPPGGRTFWNLITHRLHMQQLSVQWRI